jgi:two-component system phosphate regulon sensor histidine kinase PhoR
VTVDGDLDSASQELVFKVHDTGIGMPPEVQRRVFEKFFRAPEAQALEAQGLGLGLALVRQLVEAHGGRIVVDSAPGEGSTFLVALPAPGSQKATAARRSPDDGEGSEQHATPG